MARPSCGSITPTNSCSRRLGRNTRKILLGLPLLGIANTFFSTTFGDEPFSQVFRARPLCTRLISETKHIRFLHPAPESVKKRRHSITDEMRRASTYSTRQKQ